MGSRKAFIAVALGAAMLGPALAGHPLQTEDAGVLERGDCELEAVAERVSSSSPTQHEQAVVVGCGVGARSQLALEAGRAREDGFTGRALALGGKTRLWRGGEDETAPTLTLAWALGWDRADGGGWQQGTRAAALVVSAPLSERWIGHANLGHERDHAAGQGLTAWALALEHVGLDLAGLRWAPMAELTGDDRGAPAWGLALRLTLSPDRAWLGLAHGRSIETARSARSSLGVKLAF